MSKILGPDGKNIELGKVQAKVDNLEVLLADLRNKIHNRLLELQYDSMFYSEAIKTLFEKNNIKLEEFVENFKKELEKVNSPKQPEQPKGTKK